MDLAELKAKWFIDTSDTKAFPPQTRHPEAIIQDHSDGNLVTPLIDGENIMGYFDERMEELSIVDDPSQSELWLAAMGIEQVRLRGLYGEAQDAINKIFNALDAGVSVSFLASGQANLAQMSKRFIKQLIVKGGHGALDNRFPFASGHHQKFYITYKPDNDWEAVVSSADFFEARWDTREHLAENPNRPGGPTHEVAVMVKGPATMEIAATFAERWNDLRTSKDTDPPISRALPTEIKTEPGKYGPHSVQVLRSYPMMKKGGYSWSDVGEYTVWASYINAIKQAQTYIYIEDQYLYPLGDPPYIYGEASVKQETDFVYQLGEALKRGVDVVCLVPERNNSIPKHYENQQRRRATEYLHNIAQYTPGAGRFVVTKLFIGGKDVTIHSKVMLVDDEFALIGTANICQRSIAYITEIHVGIVDAENVFTRDLRLSLWQEHMELDASDSLLDPREAVGLFAVEVVGGNGRLAPYPVTRYRFEFPYRLLMNRIIDPYSGPERKQLYSSNSKSLPSNTDCSS